MIFFKKKKDCFTKLKMWEIKRVKLLICLYTSVPRIDMFAGKNHQILFWLYHKSDVTQSYLCLTLSSKKTKEKQVFQRKNENTTMI